MSEKHYRFIALLFAIFLFFVSFWVALRYEHFQSMSAQGFQLETIQGDDYVQWRKIEPCGTEP